MCAESGQSPSRAILTDVSRIGKRTLDGNLLTLRNRTNNTTIILTDEQAARWRKYLMAFQRKKGGSVRLTGLFKTKRNGLWTGTAKSEQIDALIEKIKEAKKSDKGLVFFLWRNDQGNSPMFSLNVAVEQPMEKRSKKIETSFEDEEPEGDSLFDD